MYCQKCRIPLKADASLETLNPAAFDLLIGSASRSQQKSIRSSTLNYPPERTSIYKTATQEPQSPQYKRNIPAPVSNNATSSGGQGVSSNPGMSFIEITQSQIVPAAKPDTEKSVPHAQPTAAKKNTQQSDGSLSQQLQRHERLFSILSSHSDIDHPVCSECSMMLVSAFNARLASATRERDAYASFLKSLQQTTRQSNTSVPQSELESLLEEEKDVLEELTKLEEQKNALEADLAELEDEGHQLDQQEKQFWKSRNAFDDQLHNLEVDLTSLQQKYAHDQEQLERLQRTNVYNDTFCIGHDGYFGTINGLRLGRLPSQNVEWAEINAAWGQTLLLLATVAERLSFTFQGYRLRPLGSTSRIEKLEWPQQSPEVESSSGARQSTAGHPPPKITQLDLYSSGDMPLGRVFNHRRFDAGMVAFLDCLSQLGKFVDKASKGTINRNSPSNARSKGVVLPYIINGDKIGEVSIRLGVGFSQDENFTKASISTIQRQDECKLPSLPQLPTKQPSLPQYKAIKIQNIIRSTNLLRHKSSTSL